jgi:hypothetical protein
MLKVNSTENLSSLLHNQRSGLVVFQPQGLTPLTPLNHPLQGSNNGAGWTGTDLPAYNGNGQLGVGIPGTTLSQNTVAVTPVLTVCSSGRISCSWYSIGNYSCVCATTSMSFLARHWLCFQRGE